MLYIAQPLLIGVRGPYYTEYRKIGKYGNFEISNFRILVFLCKMNCLKTFFGGSFCTKCNKKHYATFCKRILPYHFYGIRCYVILCIFYKYEVRFSSNFRKHSQKNALFKEILYVLYFLTSMRLGFRAIFENILKKRTFFKTYCIFCVSLPQGVPCCKAGRRRRFQIVQTPVPSRTGIK